MLVSGGNITAAPGLGSADIYGGSVSIVGGSATGGSGTTSLGGAVAIQGGLATAAGAINVIGAVNLQASGGNVGIGTASPDAKLDVNGNVKIGGAGANLTFADSTVQSTAWTGVLSGGDYAESVDVTGERATFEPGDLLVIDPHEHGHFQKSSTPYSVLIGGVYATKPGVTGRRQPRSKSQDEEVPMAMVGIVSTKVSTENGPIHDGDLLVSSSTPGYAMKGTDRDKLTGAILGKALGTLESGNGVIEVLISLQ